MTVRQLRAACALLGWSQRDLAKKSGVSLHREQAWLAIPLGGITLAGRPAIVPQCEQGRLFGRRRRLSAPCRSGSRRTATMLRRARSRDERVSLPMRLPAAAGHEARQRLLTQGGSRYC